MHSVDLQINYLVCDTCTADSPVIKPAFIPGVDLHLTQQCIVKIDELFNSQDICPARVTTQKTAKAILNWEQKIVQRKHH